MLPIGSLYWGSKCQNFRLNWPGPAIKVLNALIDSSQIPRENTWPALKGQWRSYFLYIIISDIQIPSKQHPPQPLLLKKAFLFIARADINHISGWPKARGRHAWMRYSLSVSISSWKETLSQHQWSESYPNNDDERYNERVIIPG